MSGESCFIDVAEVWTPDPETGRLTLSSGAFGPHAAFAETSKQASFAKGEGLPGKAWAEARPMVLNGFNGTYFKRIDQAAEAGLTTAIAIPSFNGDQLSGVLMLFSSEQKQGIGALEVWREDKERGGVLILEDGYYGAATQFEQISRRTEFPRGQGLPGGVWAAGAAILMRDLGASYRFLRAESAGAAGITTGLGLPIETPAELFAVTLLSATSTPIARRFEIWDAISGGDFELKDGICAIEGPLWEQEREISPWEGPIGRVAGTGAPFVRGGEAAGLPKGYDTVVATPIRRKGRLAQIAAWYF